MGVEPTGDRKTCRPPVLKTGRITGPHALPCRRIRIAHLCYLEGPFVHRPQGLQQTAEVFQVEHFVLILMYLYVPFHERNCLSLNSVGDWSRWILY